MAGYSPPEKYIHSPLHHAVATRDHQALSRLLLSLRRLPPPCRVLTEADSVAAEIISDEISAVLDRRDVPSGETPLHLAVRFNDPFAVSTIAAAGADISLQNAAGWSPLQEALSQRRSAIAAVLLRSHRNSAWSKWRRRLPRIVAELHRMRDFYMEISFHFDSSVIPFIGKLAPSETCRIWKRGGNIRADTSVAGVDGLKIRRANQSFVFLGDGDGGQDLPFGSLLVMDHENKRISEISGAPLSEGEVAGFCEQRSVYRPGMDVTKAEIVGKTNWRKKEKTESVGEWKSRVYEVHNVVFSFRSRKSAGHGDGEIAGEDQVMPLELDEDAEEGFLVAEYPATHDRRRHSSFIGEDRLSRRSLDRKSFNVSDIPPVPDYTKNSRSRSSEKTSVGAAAGIPSPYAKNPRRRSPEKKSTDITIAGNRTKNLRQRSTEKKIIDVAGLSPPEKNIMDVAALQPAPENVKEREYVKKLRPWVWLTEEFPLKTEEMLPMLEILSKKLKAVRRLKELLTAKFPTGTFPVKVAIPVLPAVRVVVTFTKFVELQAKEREELFYTPVSSPVHLSGEDRDAAGTVSQQPPYPSRWQEEEDDDGDPFAIPKGYRWTADSEGDKRRMNKSKSVRK